MFSASRVLLTTINSCYRDTLTPKQLYQARIVSPIGVAHTPLLITIVPSKAV